MKISEIKSGQGKIDVEAVIIDITPVREIKKYGKTLRVATATLQDDSGEIKLSLWNQDTEKVSNGDKIKIVNGYASEFKGEKQLTTGKFGKMEILEKNEQIRTNQIPEAQESQEPMSAEDFDEF